MSARMVIRFSKRRACGRSMSTCAADMSLMPHGFLSLASPFCLALNRS
jgi:hypothetical protein